MFDIKTNHAVKFHLSCQVASCFYLLVTILITCFRWTLTTTFSTAFKQNFYFLIIIRKRWSKILEIFLKTIKHVGKINAKKYIDIHLWETPSFPEPEVAFPISPALPPGFPLDFLAEARSFPSGSVFVGAAVGVYKIKGEKGGTSCKETW